MEREQDAPTIEVVDLGKASAQTQGQGPLLVDNPGGINIPGVLAE